MKKPLRAVLRVVEVIAVLVLLVLVVAWMAGAFRPKVEPGAVQPPVRTLAADRPTTTVQSVELPVYEEAAGTVQAVRRTAVSSRILASIKEIRVRSGDTVAPGDVVVVLDDRDLASREEQALEALRSARARLENARTEHQRQTELLAAGATAQRNYDDAQTALEVAQADVEKAQQAVEEARIARTWSKIRAPVGGRVVERLAEPGDTASPAAPLLQIYDPEALQLEAAVRESVATRLQVGQPLQVHIDALDATIQARVDEIVPQADAGARVFRVKAGLPARPGLFTGMFGRLRIPVGTRQALLVAAAAVQTIGQNHYVEAVAEDGTLTRRLVTPGPRNDDARLELLSGVEAGQRLALLNRDG